MLQRFSNWWRALGVVLLGLATITWPGAVASASTPVTVLHQDEVASLSPRGTGSFAIDVTTAPNSQLTVTIYPRLLYRGQIEPIVTTGEGAGSPIASTGNFPLDCSSGNVSVVRVGVTVSAVAAPRHLCGSRAATLKIPCAVGTCDGVYPLSLSFDTGHSTVTEWSLLTLRTRAVPVPLRVDFIAVVDPSSWTDTTLAEADFDAIAAHPTTPVTLALDYRALADAVTVQRGPSWRRALVRALRSPLHHAIVAPPANIDYAGLSRNGFSSQVAQQISLGSQLLHQLTGRSAGTPVFLGGAVSSAAVAAVADQGSRQVVIDDNALDPAPSSTLSWGAPFGVDGSPTSLALATDNGLSQLASDTAIESGRRAAIMSGTLNFMHFEAPNDFAVRTVVIPFVLGTLNAQFIDELLSDCTASPFLDPTTLNSSFSSHLIGSNGSPVTRQLSTPVLEDWTRTNVIHLGQLITTSSSFIQGVQSPERVSSLTSLVLRAEVLGGAPVRARAISTAASQFARILGALRIDNSSVTLAGSGTSLPITIFSGLHYPVTVVAHLITDRLHFPHGARIAVTLSASTTSLRIATAQAQGSNLILQVTLSTPNNEVIVARTSLVVRVAGTSWVGYILTFGSLGVLGLWWFRTHRRRSLGRHVG